MGYQIFTNILEISLIGSILILLALGIKKVLGSRLFPKAYLIMWLNIFLRLIVPFQMEGGFSLADKITFLSFEQKNQADKDEKITMTDVPSGNQPVNETDSTNPYTQNSYDADKNAVEDSDSIAHQDNIDIVQKSWDIFKVLVLVWLIGFCMILAIMAAIFFGTYRRILKSRVCEREDIIELVEECKSSIKLNKNVGIILSDLLKGPGVIGVFKPQLVLPEAFLEYRDETGKRNIILHEMYHIKYCHNLLNIVFLAVACIHWFNPLVWVALFKSRTDIESVCDEAVVKVLSDDGVEQYAKTIIQYAASAKRSPSILLHTGMIGGKNAMKSRIASISSYGRRSIKWLIVSLLLVTVLGSCGIIGSFEGEGEKVSSNPPVNTGQGDLRNSEDANEIINDGSPEDESQLNSGTVEENPSSSDDEDPLSFIANEAADEYFLNTEKGKISLMVWDNAIDLNGLLGEPISEEVIELTNADTFTGSFDKTIKYDGLEIKLFSPKGNGKSFYVYKVKTTNPIYTSARGVKVGDTVETLKEKYPEVIMALDGRTDEMNCAYLYPEKRDKYLNLFFEVNNGKVEEIYMYYEFP